MTYRR